MLLAEHFPLLAGWNIQVIATDILAALLERAQQGWCSRLEVSRGLPVSLLTKYFQPHGSGWQIAEHLRRRVTFRHLNLIQPWPSLPSMDLILMRNVLIDFNMETKKGTLGKVRRLLQSDGYLLLGSTETMLQLDTAFTRVQIDKTVCYQ